MDGTISKMLLKLYDIDNNFITNLDSPFVPVDGSWISVQNMNTVSPAKVYFVLKVIYMFQSWDTIGDKLTFIRIMVR